MKSAKSVGISVLLILVIIVVFQNTEEVETRLLFARVAMPRALLLFLTLAVGIVVGILFGTRMGRGKHDD